MKPAPPTSLPPWLVAAVPSLDAYAELLANQGVAHGLIGPREVPRLWSRHLLNCAVVVDPAVDLVPAGASVADVGSGAGLPGLAWAIVRPDLNVTLIEPLLRRATFLTSAVAELGLGDRVQVVRGRAEDIARDPSWRSVDVVTARAVAPLSRLLEWTIPLLGTGGRLVALKGSSAAEEIADAASVARRLRVQGLQVHTCGVGVVDPPTTVVVGTRVAAQ